MALQPFIVLWQLSTFLILYTVGRTARRKASTYAQNNTNTE
jgi:hypothetical protein